MVHCVSTLAGGGGGSVTGGWGFTVAVWRVASGDFFGNTLGGAAVVLPPAPAGVAGGLTAIVVGGVGFAAVGVVVSGVVLVWSDFTTWCVSGGLCDASKKIPTTATVPA